MIVHKILSKKVVTAVAVVESKSDDLYIPAAFSERYPKYVMRKFDHQCEYEQWLAACNVEPGDVLVYETIYNLRTSGYAAVYLVMDVVEDYTDIEWSSTTQPKAFLLTCIQQNPEDKWEPKTEMQHLRGFRKISEDELDWLMNNAQIQNTIKQKAPTFQYRDKAV